jgi:hypothetical protein
MSGWWKWGSLFDLTAKEARVAAIEEAMAAGDFWNEREEARRLVDELRGLKDVLERFRALRRRCEDRRPSSSWARRRATPRCLPKPPAN